MFFLVSSLYCVGVETIYYAPESVLSSMALARGLDTTGSAEEIRKRLYDYYGYEEKDVVEESTSGEEGYTLQINSAESVNSTDSTFTIEGNVVIDFLEKSSEKKTLSASLVIVDIERKIITALGNATYVDSSSSAAIKEIEADILTVSWDEGDIFITDGTTTTERENSEKKKVKFSTSGERLSYLSEGAIVFEEGYITSNPETAYSSISASSILILPGEDMFLSNATFNIGRVPIFYLPFFFFPGSKILGNPSFGFDSIKGAFLNTSFEIFGTYPKISSSDESSSFSSLLKSTDDSKKDKAREGYYYTESDSLSGIEQFAKSTSSYLVLLFDAYHGGQKATILNKGGVHFGIDSALNFFNNKLKINIYTGIATPLNTDTKKIRYYGDNSLSFSSGGLTLSVKFPYYSDRTVLYHYGNRLTGFSYGPLMGSESQFPKDYSSSGISSFTRSFTLSYSLPSSVRIPFVSSFSLKNLSIEGSYSIPSSTTADSSSILTSYTLPNLSVSLSGNFLDYEFKRSTKSAESGKTEEERKEETNENREEIKKEILLSDPYSSASLKSTASSTSTSKIKAGYTITEDFKNKVNNSSTGEKTDGKMESATYTKFSAEGNVRGVVNISNTFTNTMTYAFSNTYTSSTWSKKLTFNPLDTLKVTVPWVGITYNLSLKPFDYTEEETEDGEKNVTTNNFEFTKDFIKTHSIGFSKTITTGSFGAFTGDVTYILPPLDGSVTPSLKWSYSGFSLSLSWLFKKTDSSFNRDVAKLSLSYSSTYFTMSSSLDYQTADISSSAEWYNPFSLSSTLRLQTKNRKYYLEEVISGDGDTDGFITSLKTTLALGDIKGIVTLKRDSSDRLSLESVNLQSSISGKSFQLWKGRIYLSFGLDSQILINNQSIEKSYLTFSPNIVLSCAEFIDIKFSFKTQNNRFTSYYEDGRFSLPLMWKDLLRSIDFAGDGRRNTSFIMQSVSLEVVHYMEDWNLNFKYTTSFIKGIDNHKTVYSLQPSFSVYLSWNTMPDLKAEENWKRDASGKWTRQ